MFLLLICSAASSAQTVDFKIKADGEGTFTFTVITTEPSGDYQEINKVDLDSAAVRTLVARQLGIFEPAYTKAELKASDAKRTLNRLNRLHDKFNDVSIENQLSELAGKFDGVWRLRYGEEKYNVEITEGKISGDKNNGKVEILSERVVLIKNFYLLKDFKLFEVERGVLAGEFENEKIVLKYRSEIKERKGKSERKKN